MNNINSFSSFAQLFVWKARCALLGLSIGVPLALEGFNLARYVYQNQAVIKDKIFNAKVILSKTFTQQEGESQGDFHKRLIKNVLAVTLTITLPALGFIALPTVLAIPVALGAISVIADLCLNGESYAKTLCDRASQCKILVKDSFTPREGEDRARARIRIVKNALITVGGIIGVSLMLAASIYSISHMITFICSGKMTPWNIYRLLPLSSPLGVAVMYGILGVCHGALAIYNYARGDKLAACYYLSNCIMAFVFPAFYYMSATPENPMRVHHSFMGLFLQLLPFRCLKVYGAAVMWDSALYFASMDRGFFSLNHHGNMIFNSYDYQNIIWDNLTAMMATWSVCAMIQYWLDRILNCQKPSDKTPVPLSVSE